jgi:hypothetical protein
MPIFLMAVDMVYDILKKHNPMLACVIEGHDVLDCSRIYRGLDFTYIDNGNYKLLERNPYYRIGHAPGKDNGSYAFPKAAHFPERNCRKKPKPYIGPVLLINHNKNGRETRRWVEKKPYSFMYK